MLTVQRIQLETFSTRPDIRHLTSENYHLLGTYKFFMTQALTPYCYPSHRGQSDVEEFRYLKLIVTLHLKMSESSVLCASQF